MSDRVKSRSFVLEESLRKRADRKCEEKVVVVKHQGLESLLVWKRSVEFVAKICNEVLPVLPGEEKYGMVSQLRRAVQSIPANIAEGYGRYYYQEGIRFCYIARGSLEEVFTFLTLACRLGYISQSQYQAKLSEIDDIRKPLHGYISYLKRSKRGESEPGNIYEIHESEPRYDVDSGIDYQADIFEEELHSSKYHTGDGNESPLTTH